MSSESPFARVPSEVLRMILTFTAPPSSLLDPSLVPGPNSSWCYALRTQKSIVSVCSLWWTLGVELLYRVVVFRRIGQMAAFVRTIDGDEGPSTRASYLRSQVKSVFFLYHIPSDHIHLHALHMRTVFDRCRKLSSARYDPKREDTGPQDNTILTCGIYALTQLDLGEAFYFSSGTSRLLEEIKQLKYLSFHFPASDDAMSLIEEEAKFAYRMAQFESLKVLRCSLRAHDQSGLAALALIWSMPQLQSLTLRFLDVKFWKTATEPSLPFFHRYGEQLRTLRISSNALALREMEISGIMCASPNLEHLVIGPNISVGQDNAGQLIRWIDIFRPARDDTKAAGIYLLPFSDKERHPSLRKIRFIDRALSHIPDLPFILHPDVVGENEVVNHSFYGLAIEETQDSLVLKSTHMDDGFRQLGSWDGDERAEPEDDDDDTSFTDDDDTSFTDDDDTSFTDDDDTSFADDDDTSFADDDGTSFADDDLSSSDGLYSDGPSSSGNR